VVVQQGLGRVLFTDDFHHRIGKLVPASEMKAPRIHSLAFMAAMTAWTSLNPYGGATQLHRRAINLGLLNFSISLPGGLFVSPRTQAENDCMSLSEPSRDCGFVSRIGGNGGGTG